MKFSARVESAARRLRFSLSGGARRPLTTVAGLTDADRRALAAHGIGTPAQFFAKMADDRALLDSLGLADRQARRRVVEAMAAQAKLTARSLMGRAVVDHLPDAMVAVAVLLAVYGLAFIDRGPPRAPTSRQVVVTAPGGLPAFHVITGRDVEVRATAKGAGPVDSVQAVLGRYVFQPLAVDSVLDSTKLSAGPRLSTELDGRRIFTVKLQPSALLANLRPPVKVGLTAAPRDKDVAASAVTVDAYMLEVRSLADGVSAMVATTEADFRSLAPLLGRADLIAVGPIR
jgi:hypothetical protein